MREGNNELLTFIKVLYFWNIMLDIEIIESRWEFHQDNISLFLILEVFFEREFLCEFPFAENAHIRIGIGDFFDVDHECDRRSDEDTIRRFPENREKCGSECDKKGGLFEVVEFLEESDIDKPKCYIHKNCGNNREWEVFEKSIKEEGWDHKGKKGCEKTGSSVSCATLDVECRPDKYRRNRKSSKEPGSNIGESKSEDFFIFAEFLLGHFLGDTSRNNRLKDGDNRNNKWCFEYCFDNIYRIFHTINTEPLKRETEKSKWYILKFIRNKQYLWEESIMNAESDENTNNSKEDNGREIRKVFFGKNQENKSNSKDSEWRIIYRSNMFKNLKEIHINLLMLRNMKKRIIESKCSTDLSKCDGDTDRNKEPMENRRGEECDIFSNLQKINREHHEASDDGYHREEEYSTFTLWKGKSKEYGR